MQTSLEWRYKRYDVGVSEHRRPGSSMNIRDMGGRSSAFQTHNRNFDMTLRLHGMASDALIQWDRILSTRETPRATGLWTPNVTVGARRSNVLSPPRQWKEWDSKRCFFREMSQSRLLFAIVQTSFPVAVWTTVPKGKNTSRFRGSEIDWEGKFRQIQALPRW